jgi:hypothetical protein
MLNVYDTHTIADLVKEKTALRRQVAKKMAS